MMVLLLSILLVLSFLSEYVASFGAALTAFVLFFSNDSSDSFWYLE